MHRRRPEGAGPGGNLKIWKPADRVGSAGAGPQARQIRQNSRFASRAGPGVPRDRRRVRGPIARCEPGESGESGETENLPTCAPRGLRRRSRRRSAAAPEWAPLGQSRGGHGRPHGRAPRCAPGAREVRSPDASANARGCGPGKSCGCANRARLRIEDFYLLFSPSRQAMTSSSPRTASSTGITGCTWNTNAGSIEQNL